MCDRPRAWNLGWISDGAGFSPQEVYSSQYEVRSSYPIAICVQDMANTAACLGRFHKREGFRRGPLRGRRGCSGGQESEIKEDHGGDGGG